MISSKFLRAYAPWIASAGVLAIAAVTAIVVISPRLASTPQPESAPRAVSDVPAPEAMAGKLLAPTATAEAFDTPFFNAKEEVLTLKSLSGRGAVVNFWATWCAPCVREMPALDRLAAKLTDRGVTVIAISEDRQALNVVPPFYAKIGVENLPLHFDPKGELSRKLGVEGLPTTLLIDARGREVGRIQGVLEWDKESVTAYITQVLAPH